MTKEYRSTNDERILGSIRAEARIRHYFVIRHPCFVIIGVVFALLAIIGFSARADTIIIRGQEKPLIGNVKSEDAKTVVVVTDPKKKKGEETIPSADIVEIYYENITPSTLTVKGGAYRTGKDAEKEAETDDPATRKKAISLAIASYLETLKTMTRDTNAQKYAARNLEYKVAILTLKQATDQLSTDRAIKKLQDFSKKFPDSWQNNIVMPTIAQFHLDSKEYKEAANTYQEIADMDVFSEGVRREAELKVVEVMVRDGKIEDANRRLDTLAKKAANNPATASRVKLARAEVFIGQKQFDAASKLLKEVLKTNNDKQIKAMAHNSLGEVLYKDGKYNEALWEFLWVDAVFNQDRNQHAKALYYLWKTFEQLNNAERAQECRETLISDRQFTGSEYQRLALSQVK
jgi:predicted negative regulator of RcsB-dependent stress response